jgi:hypothetical protein
VHVTPAHGQHPVLRLAHYAPDSPERHLLRQHQDQRLEQQREAIEAAGEVWIDLPHGAMWQPDPRHSNLEMALVLEEVQVPVRLGDRVVHRMLARVAADSELRACVEVDLNRQPLGRLIELH